MELIYSNFDGLDITFQGRVPDYIRQELESARQQAERMKSPVVIRLGKHEIPVTVAETGMRGGYRYRFDTGLDGEVWCIANSDDPEQWNLRVSVKSMSLALYGYAGCKDRILEMLDKLEATGPERVNPDTGEITNRPKEAISRVDYCFDFKSDYFSINPDHFIAHSRCNRTYSLPKEITGKGQHITYARIGSIPNKQVVIYDKIREIQEHQKSYWWDIWNINKDEFKSKIWRIEVRAGKKELKEWNLRTFDDFENKIGDVILFILKEIKYVTPNLSDKNTGRWPNAKFWNIAKKETQNVLADYISNADRNEVIKKCRKQLKEIYEKQIKGMIPPYAVITGHDDPAQLPGVFEGLLEDFSEENAKNKSKLKRKFENSKNRLSFFDEK